MFVCECVCVLLYVSVERRDVEDGEKDRDFKKLRHMCYMIAWG